MSEDTTRSGSELTVEGDPAGSQPGPVIDLDDPRASEPAAAGGKAARLAELRRQGLPVPAGFVVTTSAIGRLLAAADGPNADADAVRAAELPADVDEALGAATAALGDRALAVRSSAVAEDLADASYAGQYETVLGAHGAREVADAVRRCAASARAARLAAYQPDDEPGGAMAVLVQPLVEADAAGVAFTANPVTGARDETLVSAVRGLGERLVAGEATPDEWVVRAGEPTCVTSPEGALDGETARDIAALAERVAADADAPQDVEWALAGGRLQLLQARPITALPTPPAIDPPPGTWMKDTVHYVGPMSPLSVTAYLPRMEHGATSMLAEFGFLMEAVRQQAIGWEVYAQPAPPSDEQVVAQRIATAAEVLGSGRPDALVDHWWRGGWREELRDRVDALRRADLTALDDAALDAHLQACLDLLADGQVVHFQLFVPYLLHSHELFTACEELLGWDTPAILELLAGLSEASAEPTCDLAELAAAVRADAAAAEAVSAWSPGEPPEAVLGRLRDADPALADRLDAHLAWYGCRVPAYDVGDPTFAERPERTLRLLVDLVTGVQNPLVEREELARHREEALARAREQLAAQDDAARARFEQAHRRAAEVWGLREDNLLYTDQMPNGLIRLAALEIGRRLVRRGRLRRPEDAVFCELHELRAALAAPGSGEAAGLRQRVARRRAEHAWVRANPGPPMYGDPPPPPPPTDELPAEARQLMEAMGWLMSIEFPPPGAGGAADDDGGDRLPGQPGSSGHATARARVIADESGFDRLQPGEVLVCRLTTPAWTVLFPRAAAVVTDCGSPLSHAAIVAREHGIPAVVGTQTATSAIADGQTVTVDGGAGVVILGET